jgi:Uma2 family endonuclease
MTAEELLRMPSIEFRCELVRGELKKMPFMGDEEGYVAGNIGGSLINHVEAADLGRSYAAGTGFHIASNPDTVRAPDAAFVSRERLEATGEVEGYWLGAPDLAVEVVSPNDTHSEVVEKSLEWLEAGCRMVIVVEPRRKTATVYRSRDDIRILTEGDAIDGADVVPGWRLPVSEIFA